MFIEILNTVNRAYNAVSFGILGGLFGTFITSNYIKEMNNGMVLKFHQFNRGTVIGFLYGFFIGFRSWKK